jgi:hypothetical protein
MHITFRRQAATAVMALITAFVPAAHAEDDNRYYDGRHNDYCDGAGRAGAPDRHLPGLGATVTYLANCMGLR